MAENITPFQISAPGFYGLNTEQSPVDLDKGFALSAINCLIDKSGRIASRKGWTKAHAVNADLGANDVECIAELIGNDGAATTLFAGNNKLFKLVSGTVTELTYGGGGAAPTISANKWQFCQLNGIGIFWQSGHDPLIYDPSVSAITYRRLSEKTGSTGTIYQCNVGISAYGRIWAASTSTDKQTVVWSDILTPHIWTGGTAGSVDLRNVWPLGGDEIIGMAAHNNFLFIFGKRQILIYSGANDPQTMKLEDSIVGIGCISRDTIRNIGEDVWFLSDTGVRSLQRTIQEKSSPIRTLSRNVHTDIQSYIDQETASSIHAGYSAVHSIYILYLPTFQVAYCFDTRSPLQDGTARVTTWLNINPKAFCELKNRTLLIGQNGYVGTYGGYLDDTVEYRMQYYTTWIDFGTPIQTSILKKIILTVIGGTNQTIVFKWAYDFVNSYFTESVQLEVGATLAEYGAAEYGIDEYFGNVAVNTLTAQGTSAGKVLQFGFEAQINSFPVSIQKIELFTKDGRL